MKITLTFILMIIFFVPAASFGDNCVEGACVNGKGTMTYPDGQKYSGEFKDGEKHGHGTLIYADGKTVAGEFKNGEFVKK